MKQYNYIIIGLLALIGILVIYTGSSVQESIDTQASFGSSAPSAPAFTVATTSTSVAVTTSTRILATTTNPTGTPGDTTFVRGYTVICNTGSNPVYLNLDGDKPANTSNVTAIIATATGYDACFELTDEKMRYNGSITASSTNQTSTTVSVKQYVY